MATKTVPLSAPQIARHLATRDRRELFADGCRSRLLDALRELAGSATPLPDARATVRRYARGVGGWHLDDHGAEAIAQIALSPASRAIEIEQLDEACALMAALGPRAA
jgi:hypothetical protein